MPHFEDNQTQATFEGISVQGVATPETPVAGTLMFVCEQCNLTFKKGYDEDKKKDVLYNPDGSRHKKFKYPPREENGKKIWKWTCTLSKNDWSQKKFESYKKSDFNSDFPLKSEDIIKLLVNNSKLDSKIIETWFAEGVDNTHYALAKFAGALAVCEKLGNTKSAFVGMIFKVGEKIK